MTPGDHELITCLKYSIATILCDFIDSVNLKKTSRREHELVVAGTIVAVVAVIVLVVAGTIVVITLSLNLR